MKKLLIFGAIAIFLLPSVTFAAVAFDSKLDVAATASGTSHTRSFTNTAGNYVVACMFQADTSTTLSSVQYGGQAMTATAESPLNTGGGAGGNERLYLYWLANAPTGANNITFTSSASVPVQVGAMSYTGAGTTIDAHTSTLSAGTTDLTLTMTNTANAMLAGCWRNAYEGTTAGTNTTFRSATNLTVPIGDSGSALTAGSHSIIAHDSNSRDWSGIGLSIPAATPATANPPKQELISFE